MSLSHTKKPRTKQGKFEGSLQWNVYQRHGGGATAISILVPSAAEKSFCTLATSAQWTPRTEADG